jgi:peptidoglycan biosynthesis protein MviN/MurJ (putative lipid II flippase)
MGSDLRSTYWREGLLLLGFLVLVGMAVATVALPELSDASDREDADEQASTASVADAGY